MTSHLGITNPTTILLRELVLTRFTQLIGMSTNTKSSIVYSFRDV